MTHYLITDDGKSLVVDAGCNHPDLEDSTCPINYGDCFECPYLKLIVTGKGAGQLFRHFKKA